MDVSKELAEVKKVVESTIDVDAVEKLVSDLPEVVKVVDVTVREVEALSQKTFLSCLPFLSRFWGSRKEE